MNGRAAELGAQHDGSMREALSRSALYLIMVMLIGAGLRLHLLSASQFVIDADEAIVGLMARHIAAGGPIPVFYYGQPYMGSLEALLAAFSFKLFGESNFALQLVPLLAGLALIPVVFLLGFLVHSERAGRIAATLIAVPPQALLVWSVKARGGFIELVLLGSLALVLALLWSRSIKRPGFTIALMGVVVGVGWWVNNQMAFFIPALALSFLGGVLGFYRLPWSERFRMLARQATIGVLGFLVGSLPFWVYNLTSSPRFETFRFLMRPAEEGKMLEYFGGLLTTSLPILFGARGFWQHEDLFPGASIVVWLLLGATLLNACLLVVRGRREGTLFFVRPVEVLLIFIVTTAAIFSASSFGWLAEAPRYLLPLYPAVFVLMGAALAGLRLGLGRGVTALLLCLHVFSLYPTGKMAIPGEPFVFGGERVARDHAELYQWLREQKVAWIRTNYWIGYRVAFETKEAVRFRVFQAPYQERIASYQTGSPAIELLPFVLVPAEALIVEPALRALGWKYERVERSGYVILFNLETVAIPQTPVPCAELRMHTTTNEGSAAAAADCSVTTRWGSAQPQAPGMELRAELTPARVLRGIEYDLGAFSHDFPRGLELSVETQPGEWRTIIRESEWPGVRYLLEERSTVSIVFEPMNVRQIRLRQTGSDPVFDWSVAELRAFQ